LNVVNQGIKSIVTVKEIPLPSKYFKTKKVVNRGKHVDYLYIKAENHNAPLLDVLAKTADYIYNHIKGRKPVLIHCNNSKSRTGVLVTAYLVKKENLSKDNAL
jgi:atypical dual specificity phosphatase